MITRREWINLTFWFLTVAALALAVYTSGCASAPPWNPESQAQRGRPINPSVLQGDDWAVRRCMVLRAEGIKCEPES